LYTVRRVRWASSSLLAFDASTDDFACALCPRPLAGIITRRALHLGWTFNNARTYGYSISRESGTAFRTTVESAPAAFGSDATTGAVVADARGYLPLGSRHTALAVRGAGASSWGDTGRRRVFSASGPGPQFDNFGVGTDAIGLLRGFDEASVVGERAIVANLDLRFPIRYVQRGFGTVPVFLQTIHGALFADAGNAWTGGFDAADLRRSLGAELSLDTVLGYVIPVTFTGGIAWRHDPVEAHRGWAAFGRIGRAF
jgi:outer membrane protein assembly factor BamA